MLMLLYSLLLTLTAAFLDIDSIYYRLKKGFVDIVPGHCADVVNMFSFVLSLMIRCCCYCCLGIAVEARKKIITYCCCLSLSVASFVSSCGYYHGCISSCFCMKDGVGVSESQHDLVTIVLYLLLYVSVLLVHQGLACA